MKNSHTCPKCGSRDIVRIPDHPSRYASGSNIYTCLLYTSDAADE